MGNSQFAGASGGGAGGNQGGTGSDLGVVREAGRCPEIFGHQTKALSASLELFTWGEHFLRVWEMGKLEGLEEMETVLRKHRRRLRTGSKENELERDPEGGLDVVVTVKYGNSSFDSLSDS